MKIEIKGKIPEEFYIYAVLFFIIMGLLSSIL